MASPARTVATQATDGPGRRSTPRRRRASCHAEHRFPSGPVEPQAVGSAGWGRGGPVAGACWREWMFGGAAACRTLRPRPQNMPRSSFCSTAANVLVIGRGAAGLRAAIAAHQAGSEVVVVGKRRRDDAHTVLAAGGINAALGSVDPQDSWQQHFGDTLREG